MIDSTLKSSFRPEAAGRSGETRFSTETLMPPNANQLKIIPKLKSESSLHLGHGPAAAGIYRDVATIELFNTLSGKIEPLLPVGAQALRMYCCGPTVYDYGHIGNFRTFLHVDVLRRFIPSSRASPSSTS